MSPPPMQHPEKAGAGLLPAQCRAGRGLGAQRPSSYEREGYVGGMLLQPQGTRNQTSGRGSENPNIYKQVGRRSRLLGRAEREGPPTTKPCALTPGNSAPYPNFQLLSGRLPQGRTEHLPPSNTESGSQPREGSETGGLPTLPAGWGTVPEQGTELGHRERALRSNWERQTGHLGLRHRQKLWAEVSWAWAAWPPPTWWLCRGG